tara:strand:- start:246 stop:368 length:123 start_codon:yes stop_codon:yes gene_type:complete
VEAVVVLLGEMVMMVDLVAVLLTDLLELLLLMVEKETLLL